MKKKISVVLLLLLSFSLFAGPGGGASGGPGGSPGGSHGGPGGPGGGGPGGPGGSGGSGGGPGRGDSSGGNGGQRNSGNSGNKGDRSDGYQHPMDALITRRNAKASSEKLPDSSMNFRGVKLNLSDKEPSVLKFSFSEASHDKTKISLYFNQTIKMENFKPENIFVNGKPLEKSVEIKFNKRVDSCSFVVEDEVIENIEIKNLEGYNGKKTESVKVQNEKNSDN